MRCGRLFLVRHCEATGQEASAPLTPVGQAQAILLAEHLETLGVDLVVSSPSTRALQSIAPFAQRLSLGVEIEARLEERVLSFAPRFGFETWELLSNPDVYGIEVHEERVEVARTWVPE